VVGWVGSWRDLTPLVPSAAVPTLSEADSKRLLGAYGVPFVAERATATPDAAGAAADELGYPVVAKLCGTGIAHKTERGLVRLGLRSSDEVRAAAGDLLGAARPEDGVVSVLVARYVRGGRELIAGFARDRNFGPAIMVGVGGTVAEALGDTAFRLIPITPIDAAEMIDELAARPLLGPFRGEPAVDRDRLAAVLLALSAAATAHPELVAADLNPLVIEDGVPVAVDALVEVDT
jgi:acetyl-CoA synthetase (ADP-forming)